MVVQPLKMIVLTRLGHLFVFEHVLNGWVCALKSILQQNWKKKQILSYNMSICTSFQDLRFFCLSRKKTKPLSAKHVVKLVTKVPTNNEVARTLSVIAATFVPDVHQSILITYEDFLRPIFEKLVLNFTLCFVLVQLFFDIFLPLSGFLLRTMDWLKWD